MPLSPDEIRKKRMAELQNSAAMNNLPHEQESIDQLEQIRAELKQIMPSILDAKAIARLSIISSTKPDFAIQVQLYLLSLYRQGQIPKPIDDHRFKQVLDNIVKKPQWNIRRK
ncbi:MAG: DNA-binding protein [archaeon]|nr:DNA-binding protein [archaeon]